MTTVGLSRFFIESSREIPGWTRAHNRALTLWLLDAETIAMSAGYTREEYRSVHLNDLYAHKGYREGVCLLPVHPLVFKGLPALKSRVVRVSPDTQFVTACKSRVEGEKPRKKTMALVDQLTDARYITAVLYHKDVLAEDNDRSTECEWEVVALLCQMDPEEPMNTSTLMANHFKADGGTATLMSPAQFEQELRKSYNYWRDRSFGVTRDELAVTRVECPAIQMVYQK